MCNKDNIKQKVEHFNLELIKILEGHLVLKKICVLINVSALCSTEKILGNRQN